MIVLRLAMYDGYLRRSDPDKGLGGETSGLLISAFMEPVIENDSAIIVVVVRL